MMNGSPAGTSSSWTSNSTLSALSSTIVTSGGTDGAGVGVAEPALSSHAWKSAGAMASTVKVMSACSSPQNSAHWPR